MVCSLFGTGLIKSGIQWELSDEPAVNHCHISVGVSSLGGELVNDTDEEKDVELDQGFLLCGCLQCMRTRCLLIFLVGDLSLWEISEGKLIICGGFIQFSFDLILFNLIHLI